MTLFRWSLGDVSPNYAEMVEGQRTFAVGYVVVFSFLFILTGLNLFIAIFVDFYEKQKEEMAQQNKIHEKLRKSGFEASPSCCNWRACARRVSPELATWQYSADAYSAFILPQIDAYQHTTVEVHYLREWKLKG